jgi:hypothetical protein
MPQGRALDERGMLIKKALNGAFFLRDPNWATNALLPRHFENPILRLDIEPSAYRAPNSKTAGRAFWLRYPLNRARLYRDKVCSLRL